jgi:hypothetical protein
MLLPRAFNQASPYLKPKLKPKTNSTIFTKRPLLFELLQGAAQYVS